MKPKVHNYSPDERREKAKDTLRQLALHQSFSPVYSKQYSYINPDNDQEIQLYAQNRKDTNMDELYQLIETKIKESGYSGSISGYKLYHEINDFIEDKENGSYVFMSKPEEHIIYEYHIDVYQDQFNLSSLLITSPERKYHISFED